MIDLQQAAARLQEALAANRPENVTGSNALLVQALCVVEEAGEFAGAYRRWAGLARRTRLLGVDINQVLNSKLDVIWSRGWKEGPPK